MADKREVSYGEGELLARTLKCPFYETSAKLRINIDECFHELVREIKKAQQERSKDAQENESLIDQPPAQKGKGKYHEGRCTALLLQPSKLLLA